MRINFNIIDDEEDLELGNFTSFFASEMTLSINSNNKSIVFNTTMHKTFLITLFTKISMLYKTGKSFTISTYGNAKEYKFQLNNGYLQIIEKDNLLDNDTSHHEFEKNAFYSNLKNLFNRYLKYLKKKNKNITEDKQYIYLEEQYKDLFC